MANMRMLHRSVSVNEQLAECSLLARLLYTWGIPHTSDRGVLAASPKRLKAQVLPMTDETPAEVGEAAEQLVAAGLWRRFQSEGQDFIYYPTFAKYQRIDKRRENPRDGLPFPPSDGEFPEVPGSSRQLPAKVVEVRGSEEKEEHLSSQTAANDAALSDRTAPDPISEKQRLATAKALRDAERQRRETDRLDAALAALTDTDRELLDRMLLARREERGGKDLSLLQQAQAAELYAKELAEHGPECWRECCGTALQELRRDCFTYARGCAKNWKPRTADPFGRASPVKPLALVTEHGIPEVV